MSDIPFDLFLQLVQNDDLEISNEMDVVKMVKSYLQRRKANAAPSDEEVQEASQHALSNLTEEEKKAREEKQKK